MKQRHLFFIATLVISMAAAIFTRATKPFAGPYGVEGGVCKAATINESNCTVRSDGTVCTVTFPDLTQGNTAYNSGPTTCADILRHP
ncbi:MAG: hypothetical protein ACJ748_04735 [Flavisolibacter sp.]